MTTIKLDGLLHDINTSNCQWHITWLFSVLAAKYTAANTV